MLLLIYLLLLGATYNGILSAQFRTQTLLFAGVIGAAWILLQWRWGAPYGSALDLGIFAGIAAVALSLLTNLEAWRRIALGVWYLGIYLCVWYALTNALRSRFIRREIVIRALLLSGLVVVLIAYLQLWNALRSGAPLPRPVSTFGNANTLAAFLVLLLPLLTGQALNARAGIPRLLYALYAASALLLLILTFSRGAWVGAACGMAALAVGWLISHRADLLERWLRRPPPTRRLLKLLAGGALVGVVAAALIVVIWSFSIPGRQLDLRTYLYEAGLQGTAEQPIFGHGLFTFGATLARHAAQPPNEPHAHAHNIILNVGSELGIVGIAALIAITVLIVRAIWRQRPLVNATLVWSCFAALVGGAAHHQFDVPTLVPAIALVVLILLAVAVTPDTPPIPVTTARAPRLIFAGGFALLIASGFWESANYSQYMTILSTAGEDYAGAARRLQTVIDRDPRNPVYWYEQGMLWGLAAASGDVDAAARGASAFQQFVALEPDYAMGWANLSALRLQSGDAEQALAAAVQAERRSFYTLTFDYNIGLTAEAAHADETARAAYQAALDHDLAVQDDPAWCASALRCDLAPTLSPGAQAVELLAQGQAVEARRVWGTPADPQALTLRDSIIELMLLLAEDDESGALARLDHARSLVVFPVDTLWIHLGEAKLAQYRGDQRRAEQEFQTIWSMVTIDPFEADWESGANVFYIQFLHLSIPRMFVPQVVFPRVDGLFARILVLEGS